MSPHEFPVVTCYLLLVIITIHKGNCRRYNKTNQINLVSILQGSSLPAEGVSVVIQPCVHRDGISDPGAILV